MSTPLVMALRESCGYLRDGGYHQTAQLMTVAADEIERLNSQIRALEAASQSSAAACARPAPPPDCTRNAAAAFPSPDASAAPGSVWRPMRPRGLRLGGEYDL